MGTCADDVYPSADTSLIVSGWSILRAASPAPAKQTRRTGSAASTMVHPSESDVATFTLGSDTKVSLIRGLRCRKERLGSAGNLGVLALPFTSMRRLFPGFFGRLNGVFDAILFLDVCVVLKRTRCLAVCEEWESYVDGDVRIF